MGLPSISFIVPTYNGEKTIAQCVNSVLESDYPQKKIEIIVVNNNSIDKTAEILKKFPIVYLEEPRQGRSYARNTGAQFATGDILAFIDSDCKISKNWAREISKEFRLKKMGGTQGPIIPIADIGDEENLLSKFRFYQSLRSTSGTHILLDVTTPKFPMINSATCAYRRTAFNQVGGFDILLERHEDIDLSKRIFNSGYIVSSCPSATSEVFWHGEGWKDFMQRAIAHGRTQVDYEKKWGKHEAPLKLIYYIFISKLMNLFKKNTLKINFVHEAINTTLSFISFFSFSFYWFQRNYQGEKIKKATTSTKEYFLADTRNKKTQSFYLSPNINFAFLSDKAFIKNINKNLIIQFDEIYYLFLKEIIKGSNSTEDLVAKCNEVYEVDQSKIDYYLDQFIATLSRYKMIEPVI